MHLLYGDFFLRFIRVNNPSISQSINQSWNAISHSWKKKKVSYSWYAKYASG
jgi:hypothetical protein